MSFALRGNEQEAQRGGRFGAHKAQTREIWDHPGLGEVAHGAAEQSSVSLAMVAMRSLLWRCIRPTPVKRALPKGVHLSQGPQGGQDGYGLPLMGRGEKEGATWRFEPSSGAAPNLQ